MYRERTTRGIYLCHILITAFAILFASCSTKTKPPHEASQTSSPVRIISLVPSLTQNIYQLDGQALLVGCTSYCPVDPADSIEIVSSAVKPNVEKIVALQPDLVLSSSLIPEKDLETLRKLGLTVEHFDSPDSFGEICTQFIRIGEIVGKRHRAEVIVDSVSLKVNEIRKARQGTPAPRVFMQIGASPIFAVIGHTFMDDYITFCGGINIAGSLEGGVVGREFVVSRDPDYIFVVTMGLTGFDEVEEWKKFKTLSATSHGHIFTISSDIACQSTPLTFIETLTQLSQYMKDE